MTATADQVVVVVPPGVAALAVVVTRDATSTITSTIAAFAALVMTVGSRR